MASLNEINSLDEAAAHAAFLRCCGSSRWAAAMVARRPFRGQDDLNAVAESVWAGLEEGDWREAFTAHPRIGDVESLRAKFATTRAWSEGEQAGVAVASEDVLQALAEGNHAYEERFGFIFIICATGKSAGEMLSVLQERLPNDPSDELRIAAGEQQKITRLRLEKWLAESGGEPS